MASPRWIERNRRWVVGLSAFLARASLLPALTGCPLVLTVLQTYLLLGGFLIFIIEGGAFVTYDPIHEPVPWPATNTSAAGPWTYFHSVYQAVEIVTAVNYGDFLPTTPGAKAFVCMCVERARLGIVFLMPSGAAATRSAACSCCRGPWPRSQST
jgi:hypothetical protein